MQKRVRREEVILPCLGTRKGETATFFPPIAKVVPEMNLFAQPKIFLKTCFLFTG